MKYLLIKSDEVIVIWGDISMMDFLQFLQLKILNFIENENFECVFIHLFILNNYSNVLYQIYLPLYLTCVNCVLAFYLFQQYLSYIQKISGKK